MNRGKRVTPTTEPIAVKIVGNESNSEITKTKRVKKVVTKTVDTPTVQEVQKTEVQPVVEVQPVKIEVSELPSEMPNLLESTIQDNLEIIEESEMPVEQGLDGKVKRTRKSLSKEGFYTDFETFMESFVKFFDELKENKDIKLSSKFNYIKKLKQIQTDSYKLIKIKPNKDDKKPKGESTSGFMKPINITKELATFLNHDGSKEITRVDVTKKLCQYIKDKDLQEPSDRRVINPDESLKKLFKLDGVTDTEKLTYYSLQKKLQNHIIKTTA
jgi:chromatin remodeling complex protein RSC6